MSHIFHITTLAQWKLAEDAGFYEHPSLANEGFIHLSTSGQAVETTERYYADADDLVLLEVDSGRLRPGQLVWEFAESVGEDFPHSYAPIPVSAVVSVLDWQGPASRRKAVLDALSDDSGSTG
ncbi:MAG: DUF952 domain-containing protein [Actinobacteria bacterium]|nr:DUF952 domain-containing protein [Actinomycetota bacterium]